MGLTQSQKTPWEMRIVHGLLIEQPKNIWSMWDKTLSLIYPLTYGGPTKHVNHNRREICPTPKGPMDLTQSQKMSWEMRIVYGLLIEQPKNTWSMWDKTLFNTWFLYLETNLLTAWWLKLWIVVHEGEIWQFPFLDPDIIHRDKKKYCECQS